MAATETVARPFFNCTTPAQTGTVVAIGNGAGGVIRWS